MKVLITGGAGFIGSNIAEYLEKRGVEVVVYDNLSTGLKKNIEKLNVEFIEGDILDENKLGRISIGIDAVIHLAASVGRQKSIDDTINDSKINLLGTINVLNVMLQNKIPKIIFASSAAIYGELQHDIIDENHPINPDSPYGVSKLAAEKMISVYSSLYNLKTVCLRFFNIYGKNQKYDAYGNVIPIFCERLSKNESINIFGDGEQTRDFLNVKDVAQANYLALLDENLTGNYNLGSGSSITINKLSEMLISKFNSSKKVYLPKRKGDVLHCKADIKKAYSSFGFLPFVQLEKGLEEYVQWFIKNSRDI